jgi:SMC interacting uncharacterized protein involved in chromosome segregation
MKNREAPGREEIAAEEKRRDLFQTYLDTNDHYTRLKVGDGKLADVFRAFDEFTSRLFGQHPEQIQGEIDRMIEEGQTEATELNERYDAVKERYDALTEECRQLDERAAQEGKTPEVLAEQERILSALHDVSKELSSLMERMWMKGAPKEERVEA